MSLRMRAAGLVGVALAVAGSPSQALEICAWLTETVNDEDFREVAVWMKADADANFYYAIKGVGLSDESSRMHSPSSGTFLLDAGKADKPWALGATLTPPAEIDVVAEIRATPTDVFSDEDPPLLATFTFHRTIAEDETAPPALLAQPQCQSIDPPGPSGG